MQKKKKIMHQVLGTTTDKWQLVKACDINKTTKCTKKSENK